MCAFTFSYSSLQRICSSLRDIVISIMVGHFDYKHRCLIEKNVSVMLILPSRWRDGAESLGMERTSCLCFYLPNTPTTLHLHLLCSLHLTIILSRAAAGAIVLTHSLVSHNSSVCLLHCSIMTESVHTEATDRL